MDFMKEALSFTLRLLGSSALGVISWFVYFFGFDVGFFISFIYAVATGAVVFLGLKYFSKWRHIRESNLSYREYKYIHTHLREGKLKISRIQRNMFRVGGLTQIMKSYDVIKTIRKIHSIVTRDPIRFYEIEPFYYAHLDSLAELMERYVFLDTQPVKTKEINDSLKETKRTIGEMSQTIDDDLKQLLEKDVKELQLEIKVAQKSIEVNKEINKEVNKEIKHETDKEKWTNHKVE